MPKITTEPKAQLTIRIDSDILERLEAYAKQSRIPKSIHMQLAVNEYLDARKAPWPAEPDIDDDSA